MFSSWMYLKQSYVYGFGPRQTDHDVNNFFPYQQLYFILYFFLSPFALINNTLL